MKFVAVTDDNLKIFKQMYVRYINDDLKQYSENCQRLNPSQRFLEKEAFGYLSMSKYKVRLVKNDNEEYMGFFVICDCPSQFPSILSDFHIAEFYVEKLYRRLGVGTEIVNELLKDKKGKVVSLHILEKNSPALHFWNTVFSAHADTLPVVPLVAQGLGRYLFTVK